MTAAPTPSRTEQVMEAVRRKIQSRAVEPGDKLPSIRGFAATMRVSPSTVVDAYDRLAAEGVIYARRGSGFYIADNSQPFVLSQVRPDLELEIDPLWVFATVLGCGGPNCRSRDAAGCRRIGCRPRHLRRALRALGKSDDALLSDYGRARGAAPLRRLIARRLSDQGIPAGPDQVLLTTSGSQSIDMVCRLLLQPGDTVLVRRPLLLQFPGAPARPQGRSGGHSVHTQRS